jgi:phosphoglycolate phosphatase
VVFDLDGTLVDSLPDITAALNVALVGHGVAALSLEDVRGLVGEGIGKLVEKALAFRGVLNMAPVAVAREVLAAYRLRPVIETRLYDGMLDTLDVLRRAGCRLAVLTNKSGELARSLLAELGITGHFDAVLGDGDGFPRKPDSGGLRSLLAQAGVAPGRVLMVGDAVPDIRVAKAVGAGAAAALWGYTDRVRLAAEQPDHELGAPADVASLVLG